MDISRYEFRDDAGRVHVLRLHPNENAKIAPKGAIVVQTYHFAPEQVETAKLEADAGTCFDCPFSFKGGKSGGCYTHKGLQALGLRSMLRSLNKRKDRIPTFEREAFGRFLDMCEAARPALVRLGAYGEPVTMPLATIGPLACVSDVHTGYTHQWMRPEFQGFRGILQASVGSEAQARRAANMGWGIFLTYRPKQADRVQRMRVMDCPASKESGKVLTCAECGACDGSGQIRILNH